MQDALKDLDQWPDSLNIKVGLVADWLECSVANVYRMVARNELPKPLKLGRRSVWNVGEIRAAINKMKSADNG